MSKEIDYRAMLWQPFNVTPRPNKTKNRAVSWWGHPPFHNNATQSKQKREEGV